MLFRSADAEPVRAAGLRPPARHTVVLLLGGLRELLATSFEDGVPAEEIAAAATRATIALLEMDA